MRKLNTIYNRLGSLAATVTDKLGGGTATGSGNTSTGTADTPKSSFPAVPFTVKVLVSDLNIRKGAGMNYAVTGKSTGKGVFTITEVKNGWGKLKSGAGWIYLENPNYTHLCCKFLNRLQEKILSDKEQTARWAVVH